MGVPLDSLRQYVASLTWVESGGLTSDLTHVINFMEAEYDSRWFLTLTRRAIVTLNFWEQTIKYIARGLEIQVSQSRDALDKPARESLQAARRVVKQRSIDAFTMSNPTHRNLVDCLHQYQKVLGVIEGISLALDTSLVVSEAVSVRRQEMIDAGMP